MPFAAPSSSSSPSVKVAGGGQGASHFSGSTPDIALTTTVLIAFCHDSTKNCVVRTVCWVCSCSKSSSRTVCASDRLKRERRWSCRHSVCAACSASTTCGMTSDEIAVKDGLESGDRFSAISMTPNSGTGGGGGGSRCFAKGFSLSGGRCSPSCSSIPLTECA